MVRPPPRRRPASWLVKQTRIPCVKRWAAPRPSPTGRGVPSQPNRPDLRPGHPIRVPPGAAIETTGAAREDGDGPSATAFSTSREATSSESKTPITSPRIGRANESSRSTHPAKRTGGPPVEILDAITQHQPRVPKSELGHFRKAPRWLFSASYPRIAAGRALSDVDSPLLFALRLVCCVSASSAVSNERYRSARSLFTATASASLRRSPWHEQQAQHRHVRRRQAIDVAGSRQNQRDRRSREPDPNREPGFCRQYSHLAHRTGPFGPRKARRVSGRLRGTVAA